MYDTGICHPQQRLEDETSICIPYTSFSALVSSSSSSSPQPFTLHGQSFPFQPLPTSPSYLHLLTTSYLSPFDR
jgi:hypothetical protein